MKTAEASNAPTEPQSLHEDLVQNQGNSDRGMVGMMLIEEESQRHHAQRMSQQESDDYDKEIKQAAKPTVKTTTRRNQPPHLKDRGSPPENMDIGSVGAMLTEEESQRHNAERTSKPESDDKDKEIKQAAKVLVKRNMNPHQQASGGTPAAARKEVESMQQQQQQGVYNDLIRREKANAGAIGKILSLQDSQQNLHCHESSNNLRPSMVTVSDLHSGAESTELGSGTDPPNNRVAAIIPQSVPGAHAVAGIMSVADTFDNDCEERDQGDHNHNSGDEEDPTGDADRLVVKDAGDTGTNLDSDPGTHTPTQETTAAAAEESLAMANPVEPNEQPMAVAVPDEVDDDKNHPVWEHRPTMLAMLFLFLTATGIVIGAVCGKGICSSKPEPAGDDPMESRKIEMATLLESALGMDAQGDYFDSGRPSEHALNWLVKVDPLQLETTDGTNVLQRYILAVLYYQTTKEHMWKECNPPRAGQVRSADYCELPEISSWSVGGIKWLSKQHECQWAGITCESKLVTVISLGANNLNGPLPWETSHLSSLNRLDLRFNMLTGKIPPALMSGMMPSLETLTLSSNKLTGSVPFQLRSANSSSPIRHIHLSSNLLTGTIPSELGVFPLRALQVDRNHLTGTIPLELFDLQTLELFWVSHNQITGNLPSEIGLLSIINLFFAQYTELTGTIPTELGKASTLLELDLSHTSMNGTIPEEIFAGIPGLKKLALDDCNFSGTISSSLGLLSSFTHFGIANNNFHGSIPGVIGKLTRLSQLWLNGNNLSGEIPESFCENGLFSQELTTFATYDVVADCLPDKATGIPPVFCPEKCCTSCCEKDTGVCIEF